ncbi:MAG: adenosylmethionine--8-amino-7-oxononanoate transaminase [Alphaproteobacteria bacterium]|nr:adenosylmethionine--8-amino-7-oxononanoate transaminase [Alphaproteobacteria bacterium]
MTGPDDPERLARLDHAHLWHPFTQQQRWTAREPLIISRAEGCTLYDVRGNAYIDGVASLWTNVHGHHHPALDAAVKAQLDRVAHTTMLGLSHPPAIELALRLVDLVPWGLNRVFYSDNGSTATEVALKMAFQFQQQTGNVKRTRFAAFSDGYHGDTLGAVSVGSVPLFHQIYKPLLFDAVVLPAPREPGGEEEAACIEKALALLDAHADELAAFVFEPLVQGAAGMKMHSASFLKALCERARKHGILLVADEVATGFGRTGSMFAMEQVGITPDFLCIAKGLAAGYLPLAATLTTEVVYSAFLGSPESHRQFFHGHTFTGNPLACAAALASLDVFEEEGVLPRVDAIAKHLAVLLKGWFEKEGVASVRQCGVMAGIDLVQRNGEPWDPAVTFGYRVCMRAREQGVLLRPLGDTLVVNPPLAIRDVELTKIVRTAAEAMHAEQG